MKIPTISLFVFILTFILVLFLIIFYQIIKPDFMKKQYNFSPFPTIKPTDIPDYDIGQSRVCTDVIKACDPVIGCGMCSDQFECTGVSDKENVVVNGQKLAAGNWCLPKGKNSLGCGTYTGRAVWSERATGDSMEQKWSCVCLYPDLFTGDSCTKQIACKDRNISDPQTENLLKSSDGHIWNPNDQNFNPQGKTPYDRDSNGNPLYTCDCNANNDTDGVKFVQLPNDPYRCHAEPCTADHKNKLWNKDQKMCNCSAIKDINYVHSNVTGQCLIAPCEWDHDKNQCKCDGDTGSISLTCESDTMKRPSYTDPNPCPLNQGGSYCKNPCEDKCQNSGIPCVGTWQGDNCIRGGTECNCKCSDTGISHRSGKYCENECVKDGTKITSEFKKEQCCNGTHSTTKCAPGCTSGPGCCQTVSYCGKKGGGGGGDCIGSSTILQTYDGPKKLGDIIHGAKILTWNSKTSTKEYQSVIGIYKHENVKTQHFEINTVKGDRIVLSKYHNIYRSNNILAQCWQLAIGDEIKTLSGTDRITSIIIVYDIPLTPIVYNGNVITEKGSVVSSWSGDEENVNLMNKLVTIIKSYVDSHTPKETNDMIQEAYTIFRDSSKSISLIPELMRKYNIPIQ